MTTLDTRGYPHGYEPRGWTCPTCGDQFHDEEERGNASVSWHMPAECGACGIAMVPDESDGAHDPATLRAMAERWSKHRGWAHMLLRIADAMEEAGTP